MLKSTRLHFYYVLTIGVLILIGLYFAREEIAYSYIHGKLEKSACVIRLGDDVELTNSSGRVVGVLYKGAELMSPQVDDLNDTDLSHNMRYKILMDMSPGISSSLVKKKEFTVYKIKTFNGGKTTK